MEGLVTKYCSRPRKGKNPYGFIDGYDGESYFFSDKAGTIKLGDNVKFKARTGDRGFWAADVQVVDGGENGEV